LTTHIAKISRGLHISINNLLKAARDVKKENVTRDQIVKFPDSLCVILQSYKEQIDHYQIAKIKDLTDHVLKKLDQENRED